MDVLDFIKNIPAPVWESLAAAFILSPVGATIKRFFSIQRGWVMFVIIAAGAAATSFLAYSQFNPDMERWVVGVMTAMTYFMSQPIYYAFVKPLSEWIWATIDKANHFDEQVMSAAVPEGGVPTLAELPAELVQPGTPTQPGPDFSN